jgi:hypothetical protein
MSAENTAAPVGLRGVARGGRRASRATAGVTLIAVLLVLVLGVRASRGAPSGEDALGLLQIAAADRRRLESGAIVSYAVPEASERELTTGLAMLVPAPLPSVTAALVTGQLIAQDVAIASLDVLSDRTSSEALAGARFTSAERAEAERLLEAEPGTRFNLSPVEIEALRRLQTSPAPASPAQRLAQVWNEYGRLLGERWQAYRQGGISAVAPYARAGGALRDPAAELRLAAENAARLPGLAALRDTLLRYPDGAAGLTVDRFYWVRQQLQRRPALSLLHQMVQTRAGAVVHVERYFYVGHSYNSAQTLTGAVARSQSTLLFCTTRISTDEVLGPGQPLKRAAGRKQLEDSMRQRLERFQALMRRDVPAAPIQTP